jgi:hypothetical protein
MTDNIEKHYSIDPGMGKKMDGCPYSNYEDGHDVQEYIIPPKGYVFTGFRFDPDAKNQVYDGKLIATYSKEPFKIRLKSNMWKFLLAAIIVVVIGLIVLLTTNVFREPKSTNNTPKEPKTEATSQPSKLERTDNSLSKTTKRNKKSRKERKKDKKNDKNKLDTNTSKQDNSEIVQPKQEPANQPQEPVTQPQEPAKPAVTDPNVQFKEEFWSLVHQRTFTMDSYHDLYTNYKGKVEGDEFNYLRYTILKDYVSYKAWYDNLKKIPESQLQSINTIDELKKRIKE